MLTGLQNVPWLVLEKISNGRRDAQVDAWGVMLTLLAAAAADLLHLGANLPTAAAASRVGGGTSTAAVGILGLGGFDPPGAESESVGEN